MSGSVLLLFLQLKCPILATCRMIKISPSFARTTYIFRLLYLSDTHNANDTHDIACDGDKA